MDAFWYDGRLLEGAAIAEASLPFDNPGLRFGATVFTTLRVYENDLGHPLTLWVEHCDRLENSLTKFNWVLPDWDAIRAGAQRLAANHPVLRIALFSDGREWITGRSLPTGLAEQQSSGISAWIAPPDYARSLPTHKTGNYLACWLAKSKAEDFGASEAILTSSQGEWLETSTGNLWGWKDGHWWTPGGDRALPGLMRNWLLASLRESGAVVDCRPWDAELVLGFDAIAYSNCVVQLLPIHTILSGQSKLIYSAQHASIKALQTRIATVTSSSQTSSQASGVSKPVSQTTTSSAR